MTNENQKHEQQPEQKQPTTPAQPVELTDEELQQVTGGFDPQPIPPGKPQPDPTAVE